MNINKFAQKVAVEEGGKQNLSIAQILEVIRICNKLTCGWLYFVVRLLR